MPKPKSTTDTPEPTRGDTVETMSLQQLRDNVKQALGHVAAIRRLLPGLVSLPDPDRRTTDGRFRDGETDALRDVLDLADERPHLFEVLADKDDGSDPDRFETRLIRERFDRRDVLAEVAGELTELDEDLDDTILHFGERSRPVTLAAYEIAKPMAKHDVAIRAKLSRVLNFYGRPARRAAETRARNKEQAAAAASEPAKK